MTVNRTQQLNSKARRMIFVGHSVVGFEAVYVRSPTALTTSSMNATDALTTVHRQFIRQRQESSDSRWLWSLDRLRCQGVDGRKVE